MTVYERLNNLVEEKEKQNLTDEDKELLDTAKYMIEDKKTFFLVDMDTVLGMLYFLGVPKDKLELYYMELISPENYKDSFPQERIGISI